MSTALLRLGIRKVDVEQGRAQRLAVRVEGERPGDAAAEGAGHDEIQRRYVGQFIAHHLAFNHAGKMRFHPFAGDLRQHLSQLARFLTGSAAEVTPVSEIGTYRFKPGKLTEILMNAYADEVRGVKVPA